MLDATAAAFGFEIQYGAGKAEVAIVLRGPGKQHAMQVLARSEVGDGQARSPVLTLANGKQLRVVHSYKHFGALVAATLRFGLKATARSAASSATEAVLAKQVCSERRLSQQVRINVATAIQASLLYTAATWPARSHAPKRKLSRIRSNAINA